MGRSSDFTQETADLICEGLAEGLSLREICRSDDMPDKSTVFRWLAKNEEFRDQYARAKEAGIEALAEEILDIADDATNDWIERNGDDNQRESFSFHGEHVQRSRLRIDSRKWLLSKLAPKKYGDKVQQEVTGADGGPLDTKWTVEFVNATPEGKPET